MGSGFSKIFSNTARAEKSFLQGQRSAAVRQYSEAECHFLLAWVLFQKEYGVSHKRTIASRRKVADMCMHQTRYEDAEEAYYDVVRALLTNPKDDRIELLCEMYVQLAITQYSLCLLVRDRSYNLVREKRGAPMILDQCEENLLACIQMLETRKGRRSLLLTTPMLTLSEVYANTNRCQEAVPILQRCLGLQHNHLKSTQPEVAAVRGLLAMVKTKARREKYQIAALHIQKNWRMVMLLRHLGKTVIAVRKALHPDLVEDFISEDNRRLSFSLNKTSSFRTLACVTPILSAIRLRNSVAGVAPPRSPLNIGPPRSPLHRGGFVPPGSPRNHRPANFPVSPDLAPQLSPPNLFVPPQSPRNHRPAKNFAAAMLEEETNEVEDFTRPKHGDDNFVPPSSPRNLRFAKNFAAAMLAEETKEVDEYFSPKHGDENFVPPQSPRNLRPGKAPVKWVGIVVPPIMTSVLSVAPISSAQKSPKPSIHPLVLPSNAIPSQAVPRLVLSRTTPDALPPTKHVMLGISASFGMSPYGFVSPDVDDVAPQPHDPLWGKWQSQYSYLYNPVVVHPDARMWRWSSEGVEPSESGT